MKVVIALGSNLGQSREILTSAVEEIKKYVDVTALSSFHRTAPVGGPTQPDYLNAVLIGQCSALSPDELLHALHEIEANAGRTREVHWGPRTLDLDLICYGDLSVEEPNLTLPHPRAHERAFVLAPWFEIDPDAVIPGKGSVKELLHDLS